MSRLGKEMMISKILVSGMVLSLLEGCIRPATVTSWSPIASQPGTTPTTEVTAPFAGGATIAEPLIATQTPSVLPTSLPHSMKGYELYAWQQEDTWYFTLFTGTNRSKSFDEIIAPGNQIDPSGLIKITVAGIDQLETVLALLPAGEQITWGGMDLGSQVPGGTIYLTFPPQVMIDSLQKFCQEHQLDLAILKE